MNVFLEKGFDIVLTTISRLNTIGVNLIPGQ